MISAAGSSENVAGVPVNSDPTKGSPAVIAESVTIAKSSLTAAVAGDVADALSKPVLAPVTFTLSVAPISAATGVYVASVAAVMSVPPRTH